MYEQAAKCLPRKTTPDHGSLHNILGGGVPFKDGYITEECHRMVMVDPIVLRPYRCRQWSWRDAFQDLNPVDTKHLHILKHPLIVVEFLRDMPFEVLCQPCRHGVSRRAVARAPQRCFHERH